jgi:hypothetical protein
MIGSIFLMHFDETLLAANLIRASHPYIQYFGRWDLRDSTCAKYSWPGVYLRAEFTGTGIGIRLDDHTNYFNVYIDGSFLEVFHGTQPGKADYMLAQNLPEGKHTLLLSRRNITFEEPYSFFGLLLDSAATILEPSPKPDRKIEFIGDSFTVAESNETKAPSLPWEERYPVTNIDKGFAPIVARHFHAQYATICRSGAGMFCDWRGDTAGTLPKFFKRTLMEKPEPLWDFKEWIPQVVVVSLGLNDFSGLKDSSGNVSENKSKFFRSAYHDFLNTIRHEYAGVKIVALAPYTEWARKNAKQIVDEEKTMGKKDIYYATYDEFPGGYVGNGHPTVETHKKMADQIIAFMESFRIFPSDDK